MDDKIQIFIKLANLFLNNHFSLYLVGGTVRDYLLNKDLDDMDAVTDATPTQIKSFLPNIDFTFARMGSIKVNYEGIKFDITTLRKEKKYKDSRHPNDVKFVKHLFIDVRRRDFKINAIYLNKNLKVIDYYNGRKDLKNKIISMVGSPNKRLKEDPLRILRALRFSLMLDFKIERKLDKSIRKNVSLLNKLNKDKIKMDLKKIKNVDKNRINELFIKYNIQYLLDMID